MRFLAFTATWCGPCRNLKPFLEDASYNIDLHEHDVDTDEGKDLIAEYGVTSVPTVVVLDHNGDEVERIIGISGKQLEKLVSQHI